MGPTSPCTKKIGVSFVLSPQDLRDKKLVLQFSLWIFGLLGPKRVHSAAHQEASDLTQIGAGDEGSWPCAETRWHGDSIHQQSMLPYKGRGVKTALGFCSVLVNGTCTVTIHSKWS